VVGGEHFNNMKLNTTIRYAGKKEQNMLEQQPFPDANSLIGLDMARLSSTGLKSQH
jgi:hypothetical protein